MTLAHETVNFVILRTKAPKLGGAMDFLSSASYSQIAGTALL